MAGPLADQIVLKIQEVAALYYRLVIVASPAGSGKTKALQEVAARTRAPLINLNLELSRRLLDLTKKQRALQVPRVLEEVVGSRGSVLLLDNTEIIFDVSLKLDPLRLLQGLSRNRTVVASWNGTVEESFLVYASPDHPEYQRYAARDLVVVFPEDAS